MANGNKVNPRDLAARLRKLPQALRAKAGQALYAFAREVIEPAAMDNVPILDGVLKGTIETLKPVQEVSNIVVRVVAGGPAAPYAIAVHEHLSEHSPESWRLAEAAGRPVHFNVGGPKYMERALNDHAKEMPAAVGRRVDIKSVWEAT